MPTVALFKQDGTQNGDVQLNDAVFGIEPNNNVVFDAVIMQRASLRQGTHAVKNRSAVRGGGKKPWRQKGTGRARQGSIRSPQWVGGGTVFGPTPRSYAYKLPRKVRRLAIPWRQKGTGRARQGSIRSPQWVGGGTVFGPTPRSYAYKLPRKVRRLAIKSVLSQKVLDNSLVVVDALTFEAPKTKAFAEVLNNLDVKSKVLVVLEDDNKTAALAARNLANVTVIPAKGLNVLDVVNNDKLVITKGALSQVEEVLA